MNRQSTQDSIPRPECGSHRTRFTTEREQGENRTRPSREARRDRKTGKERRRDGEEVEGKESGLK